VTFRHLLNRKVAKKNYSPDDPPAARQQMKGHGAMYPVFVVVHLAVVAADKTFVAAHEVVVALH